ncbi:HupE/UreJ family protein [Paenibacillus sp. GD4]|uniref:HupE/UreJ family protein n=1 Tax=Paenibacillus sp. GD4 TaxID=3068890 RepID=UPI0027964A38|nr:HupE/UreJ family protein [Paenibacillus sp. GD4]MDQ1908989.1 HupE/UreJ family protein [Paenibacillus sp. GD4]
MDVLSLILYYLDLGLEHIITGYDHLLFLLALIIVSKKFAEVLKIVTAFTVAHSITLTLAAIGWIPANPNWIEAGIALTICYVAIENFFVTPPGWRWMITFLFGLIHGIGFATAISDIGFDQKYFITSLVSFNVGIELGQLACVALVLPILIMLQKKERYYTFVFRGASASIFVIAALWFVDRLS